MYGYGQERSCSFRITSSYNSSYNCHTTVIYHHLKTVICHKPVNSRVLSLCLGMKLHVCCLLSCCVSLLFKTMKTLATHSLLYLSMRSSPSASCCCCRSFISASSCHGTHTAGYQQQSLNLILAFVTNNSSHMECYQFPCFTRKAMLTDKL